MCKQRIARMLYALQLQFRAGKERELHFETVLRKARVLLVVQVAVFWSSRA
jgi:hypothetical protein